MMGWFIVASTLVHGLTMLRVHVLSDRVVLLNERVDKLRGFRS